MKKYVFMILVLITVAFLAGCGKKQQAAEQISEPMSIEQISVLDTEGRITPESKTQMTQGTPAPVTETKLEPLPPSGPYKPTNQQIQTALKNAGFYTGTIDGKTGPMTKKAIEEFQKANGLKVDGIVGPKTWAVLSKYLNPTSPITGTKK